MYGLISQVNSGGNIRFYRAMALGGLLTSLLFAAVFNLVLVDVNELLLDRLIVILYCSGTFALGFKNNIKQRNYSFYMYIGFYLYMLQSLFACWYNDFSGAYFPIFILVNLICIYAFRKDSEALLFSCIGSTIGIALIMFSQTITTNDKWVYLATILTSNALSIFTARIKNKFMNEMKLNQKILKSLITRTENGMFVTDTTGLIFDINQRAMELFGYAKEELLDVDFRVLRKNPLTQEEIEDGFSKLNEEYFWTQETVLTKNVPVRTGPCQGQSRTSRQSEKQLLGHHEP
jgi:PAS domain S-box-containing protein